MNPKFLPLSRMTDHTLNADDLTLEETSRYGLHQRQWLIKKKHNKISIQLKCARNFAGPPSFHVILLSSS